MMHYSNSMFSSWFQIIFVILIILAIIVANDANKRGYNGLLWGVIVVFLPMMGIFFYLIFISVRPVQTIGPANTQRAERYTPPAAYNPQYQAPVVDKTSGDKLKYCVSCGKGNIEDADFCNACGSEIPKLN